MRFTPTTVFASKENVFPVNGALYRFEPALYGELNAAETEATGAFYNNPQNKTEFDTDTTASVYTNNVAIASQIGVIGLTTGSDFGTVLWAWRCRNTGSIENELEAQYLFDFRDGPQATPSRGIENGYINLSASLDVGSVYESASYYNAYGNQDLQKYEINTENLKTINGTEYTTGSQSFPGYWNNTITGSDGLIYQNTGSNAYRFTAVSPNSAQTPTGNIDGNYNITIFGNDNIFANGNLEGEWYWRTGSGEFDKEHEVFNIAAVAVFNRVLSDSEVRDVFNYYTSSLGLEIGL